ncbi:amino acid adenylation domain-containing protein [Luteimonas sp. XNQY3]|nr:non-ribosomal peptide synthetase [Luteimonas sp. XNQY3]MCD9006284.1 amino acid adenylation domain-containing protein [Luteimonas sp. XNQY3]
MAAQAIIARALQEDIVLFLKGDGLSYRTAAGRDVPDALRTDILANKAAIIDHLRQRQHHDAGAWTLPRIGPGMPPGDAPLSYGQQQLLLVNRMDSHSAQFNIQGAYHVTGPLDIAALQAAIDSIVARHDILRTHLVDVDGVFIQRVEVQAHAPVAFTSLRDVAAGTRDDALECLIRQDATAPFDLQHGPLLRMRVIELGADEHVIVISMHHIASDGWSLGVLSAELAHYYSVHLRGAHGAMPPLELQYADYARWQRGLLQGGARTRALAFWREQLADAPVVHALPLDHPRPERQNHAALRVRKRIDPDRLARLHAMCREHGATLFMLLQSALSVLLHRFGGERDVVMGTPMSGRTDTGLEPLIGLFINTVVLRDRHDAADTFRSRLLQARQRAPMLHEYQYLPFDVLVEELNPPRSSAYGPLFQVWFVLQNNARIQMQLPGCTVREESRWQVDAAKHDINLYAVEDDAGLSLDWVVRISLFEPETVDNLAQQYDRLLDAIVEAPDTLISEHALFDATPALAALDGGADAAPPPLLDQFLQQVQQRPDATAVLSEAGAASYRDIDAASSTLCSRLRTVPGTHVGLCLSHGADIVVAIWACIKAGRVYVPLNPEYPAERLQGIVEDAGVACVLVNDATELAAGQFGQCALMRVDAPTGPRGSDMATVAFMQPHPTAPAYVLYTSGSTGRPKGVMQCHGHVAYYVQAYVSRLRISPADRLLQLASFSHDAAVLDMFAALTTGACLHLLDPKRAGAEGVHAVLRGGVSIYHSTPTVFRFLFADGHVAEGEGLRAVVFGGEAVDAPTLALATRCLPGSCEVVNLYGSSEATLVMMHARRVAQGLTPCQRLGGVVAGTRLWLEAEGRAVARLYQPGEIVVESTALATGYLGQPTLSSERFGSRGVSTRFYRTGDMAYLRPDGTLRLLGRRDNQFKLHGQRIEAGEIEAVLAECAGVQACAVIPQRDALGHVEQIVGFVTAGAHGQAWPAQERAIRRRLMTLLPPYMVPARLQLLAALPRTASGKLDRQALVALADAAQAAAAASVDAGPRTPTQTRVLAIWSAVLGRSDLRCDQGFFAAGGHSLLAMRLSAALGEAFGCRLQLADLFVHQTIAEQAALIDAGGHGELGAPLVAGAYPATQPDIQQDPQQDIWPLSYPQQRLYFLSDIGAGAAHYNLRVGLTLEGALDVGALRQALDCIVDRHQILRTRYVERAGEAWQQVMPAMPMALRFHDLAALERDARDAALHALMDDQAHQCFDLVAGDVMAATLVRCRSDMHVVLLVAHHIAVDGVSMRILAREFAALYQAARTGGDACLPGLAFQYGPFAEWQRAALEQQDYADHVGYWMRALAGVPHVHGLATDRARPARQDHAGASHREWLHGALLSSLRALAARQGCTLFVVVKALLSLVLARHGSHDDVVIGVPAAGRSQPGSEALIGFFADTLVFRHQLDWSLDFEALLDLHMAQAAEVFAHQHVPFEMLVDMQGVDRSPACHPLIQVFLSYQDAEQDQLVMQDLQVDVLPWSNDQVKFDLELVVQPSGDALALEWRYATSLFDPATIERMAQGWLLLAQAVVDSVHAPLRSFDVLTGADRQRLACWNTTDRVYASHPLHEQIAAQATRTPTATAVVDSAGPLDYRALMARADVLARCLRQRGVKPGALVGVHLPRTADLVIALVGILRAGAAYVPLDPSYPHGRLAHVAQDSGVRCVVTARSLASAAAALATGIEPVLLDALDTADAAGAAKTTSCGADAGPDDLAYVMYTSGSTGQPKGVMVEHRQLINFAAAMQDCLPLQDGTWLALTACSFDISILELLCPLAYGHSIVLGDHARRADQDSAFPALIERHAVTHLQCTPSLLHMYMELPDFCRALARIKVLMVGGEGFPPALVGEIRRHTRARLFNLYGPTETTIWSSCAELQDDGVVSIGRPVANTRFLVVNAHLRAVPIGVQGELLIGGAGVARGYLGRDDLTAERFIRLPDGTTAYRTGDLVRWTNDGVLLSSGRCDRQVKIRGHRVEPAEVEQQLRALHEVRHAAVTVWATDAGEQVLVAYLVPLSRIADPSAWRQACRDALAGVLAPFMMPAAFVILDQLPLTPNGKVDHQALPRADATDYSDVSRVEPLGETESRLLRIWRNLLGHDGIGATSDFFAVGGHSLLATRLVSAIRAEWGVALTLRDVFECHTIREQARRVERATVAVASPAVPHARPARVPASAAQRRLWLAAQGGDAADAYNIVVGLRLTGDLDKRALQMAVDGVVERHEVLRTVFSLDDDGLWQHVRPCGAVPMDEQDATALDPAQQGDVLDRLLREEASAGFASRTDLMLRAVLVALGDMQHVLILSVHHVAADAWSMDVLVSDIAHLYAAARHGRPGSLRPLPWQYADVALEEQADADGGEASLDYWRQQLANVPALSLFPADAPRPARRDATSAEYRSTLDADTMRQMQTFCHANGLTPFMVLASVLALVLARYSDQNDVVIGTPVAGRLDQRTEVMMGCFINVLPLRTTLCPEESFASFIARSRAVVLDAFAHQDVSFDRMLEVAGVRHDPSHAPLFQVLFTLNNLQSGVPDVPGLDIDVVDYTPPVTKYDLQIGAWEQDGALMLSWHYAAGLFSAQAVAGIAEHFELLLVAAMDAPYTPILALPMLSRRDAQFLAQWNDTVAPRLPDRGLHSLFEEQARRTPDALAITDGRRGMTFGELDALAGRHARALHHRGVRPGEIVALHVGPSLAQVIGVLSILKAGAAYLPLELDMPGDRLAHLCADSHAGWVVTTQALSSRCASWAEGVHLIDESPASENLSAVCMDEGGDEARWHPEMPAYVIYTSGSTGAPKGVVMPHRAVVNYLDHAVGYLKPHHRGAVMSTPLGFDATVTTLFTPLLTGRCLVVLPGTTPERLEALADYLFANAHEWLFKLTPAHLDALHALFPAGAAPVMRRHCLVIGGEQLRGETVRRWQVERLPLAEYVNEYGPTETAVGCSVHYVDGLADGMQSIPIGRPIRNTRLHVVNAQQQPVPVGAIGELWISGDGVGHGYLGQDALTHARFVQHVSTDGMPYRAYRSGDMVRLDHKGRLQYLGRQDDQVKIRGHRIELGELEAQLLQDDRVLDAAVTVQGHGDARRLLGFVVSAVEPAGRPALVLALRDRLSATLPAYMQPDGLAVVDCFALTGNGKIDRSALPVALATPLARPYRAPTTETERMLATLWEGLLERTEPVGLDDDFFRLGGHSLLATRMVQHVNRRWQGALQLRTVFERRVLVELAAHIDQHAGPPSEPPSDAAGDAGERPLYEEMEW